MHNRTVAIAKLTSIIAQFEPYQVWEYDATLFHGTLTTTPGVTLLPSPTLEGAKWFSPKVDEARLYPLVDLPSDRERERVVFLASVRRPLNVLTFPSEWAAHVIELAKPVIGRHDPDAAWQLEREVFPTLVKNVFGNDVDGAIKKSGNEILIFSPNAVLSFSPVMFPFPVE